MKVFLRLFLIIIFIVLAVSCTYEEESKGTPEYINDINEWHNKRIANLKKENGWLNLVGLYWLKEGEQKFGSDQSNDIVFPAGKADKFLGSLILKDSVITTVVNPEITILHNSNPIDTIEMKADITGETTVLEHGSLRWFIIKRGSRYGIRLRDLEAELLSDFEGIERFPVNEDWKIKAVFEKYDPPKKILIPTILGTIEESYSPGKLIFTIGSEEYSLEPTSSGSKLFIVYADLTSGEETYGAGRFLYVDGPDSNNTVILDFNKSYNPPCAFTKYATCPLPPDENKLKVRITAGEKNYGEYH
jgi:uncharacterized protein (DUF1684 family)